MSNYFLSFNILFFLFNRQPGGTCLCNASDRRTNF